MNYSSGILSSHVAVKKNKRFEYVRATRRRFSGFLSFSGPLVDYTTPKSPELMTSDFWFHTSTLEICRHFRWSQVGA
jgi:hypothetical protein